jgi:hypothetical protein
MPEPFSIRGNKETKKLTKIGHDTTVIKPTLQHNHNPQLDSPMPECFNTIFTERWKGFTSINAKVSNLIHN